MKYLSVDFGKLIESFVFLPSFDLTWMTLKDGRFYDFRFIWLFWYVRLGTIKKKLKEDGYY